MLVDHPDAEGQRILRRTDTDLPAVHGDCAAVRLIHAVQYLHQGGLAGAVLTQYGQDFPPAGGKVHTSVGKHPGKDFRDPAEGKGFIVWGFHDVPPPCRVRRAREISRTLLRRFSLGPAQGFSG